MSEWNVSRIYRAWAVPLLLGIANCSPPADAGPTTSVARSEALNADLIAIESDTLVDGKRPRLSLICRPGLPANFQVDLVRPPAGPPAGRVFAQMQVKGGPEVTVELRWLEDARWEAKMPDPNQPATEAPDRNNQERVVPILHAFSRERMLTITPPAQFGPAQKLVWNPRTYAPHLAAVQSCAALDRFPGREG
jgi:hypothetical protein